MHLVKLNICTYANAGSDASSATACNLTSEWETDQDLERNTHDRLPCSSMTERTGVGDKLSGFHLSLLFCT